MFPAAAACWHCSCIRGSDSEDESTGSNSVPLSEDSWTDSDGVSEVSSPHESPHDDIFPHIEYSEVLSP